MGNPWLFYASLSKKITSAREEHYVIVWIRPAVTESNVKHYPTISLLYPLYYRLAAR
jgi:hypothetical protein